LDEMYEKVCEMVEVKIKANHNLIVDHPCRKVWQAAQSMCLPRLMELYRFGRNIDSFEACKPESFKTPFHIACLNDDLRMVQWLCSLKDSKGRMKINVNYKDNDSRTPFWNCVVWGRWQVAFWLAEHRKELKIDIAYTPDGYHLAKDHRFKPCWEVAPLKRYNFPEIGLHIENLAKEDGTWFTTERNEAGEEGSNAPIANPKVGSTWYFDPNGTGKWIHDAKGEAPGATIEKEALQAEADRNVPMYDPLRDGDYTSTEEEAKRRGVTVEELRADPLGAGIPTPWQPKR
jgi:hypothetical protein